MPGPSARCVRMAFHVTPYVVSFPWRRPNRVSAARLRATVNRVVAHSDWDADCVLEAAVELLNRQPLTYEDEAYVPALVSVCEARGAVQPNEYWAPLRASFLEKLDNAADGQVLPLVFRGAPYPFEAPLDGLLGYVAPKEVATLLKALPRVSIDSKTPPAFTVREGSNHLKKTSPDSHLWVEVIWEKRKVTLQKYRNYYKAGRKEVTLPTKAAARRHAQTIADRYLRLGYKSKKRGGTAEREADTALPLRQLRGWLTTAKKKNAGLILIS